MHADTTSAHGLPGGRQSRKDIETALDRWIDLLADLVVAEVLAEARARGNPRGTEPINQEGRP